MSIYNISILEHIKEFKYRFIYIIISSLINFLLIYSYSLEIFYFFAKPLINLNINNFKYSLIYTDISEAFFTYLNLSLYLTFFLSLLFLGHHIFYFLISGLYKYEYIFIKKIIKLIYLACFLSLILTYFIIIPLVWHFFISNDTSLNISAINIHFEGKLNEYIFLLLRVFFSIFCICISPLFLFILIKLKMISIHFLINQRKIAFILILILGALLSPPDVLSQVLIAFPLILNYEIIIFFILYQKRKEIIKK